MNRIALLSLCSLIVTGCVSGPPKLTDEQKNEAQKIEVIKSGSDVNRKYEMLRNVEIADCSSQGGGWVRIWGNEGKAIEGLVYKAYLLKADAIIGVSCSAAPLVNNCWAAKRCIGTAVKWIN